MTFRTHLDEFTNRDLRHLTTQLRGLDPESVTTGQTSYDLRSLRSHGLIPARLTAATTTSPTKDYEPRCS